MVGGSFPKVYVVGIGMTKFEKPGVKNLDYPQIAGEAVIKALRDARINPSHVDQACVGYVYGDSTCGQRVLYEVGVMGVPIYNVNNNCATGSTALFMAKQIIESGGASCVLALGFDKMEKGPLISNVNDRTNPLEKHVERMAELVGLDGSPIVAQLFGNAGKEHMERFGTKPEHFAKIAYKNHKHSTNNPNAQIQKEYSLEEILKSPQVFGPLTKLQCCPTSDGAAAAVLANEEFVIRHNLQRQAVHILGMEMVTDLPTTFDSNSLINLVGYDMTHSAAQKLFSKTGLKAADVDVIELHDCFSTNELITYEALGLCPPGKAGEFIDSGNNTYGGRHVINPSGGLISKGHPLGATGVAQCAELCWQLRGQAGKRQVPHARLALQHNIGLGGAVVVALYQLGFPQTRGSVLDAEVTSAFNNNPSVCIGSNPMNLLGGAGGMKDDKVNHLKQFKKVHYVKNALGKEGLKAADGKIGKLYENIADKFKPQLSGGINNEPLTRRKLNSKEKINLNVKSTNLTKLRAFRTDDLRSKM